MPREEGWYRHWHSNATSSHLNAKLSLTMLCKCQQGGQSDTQGTSQGD